MFCDLSKYRSVHAFVIKSIPFYSLRFLLYPFLPYLVGMKILRNNKLKHLGASVIILTLFVLIVQFFILGVKENQLEDAELKIEFTQWAQLSNQKISLMVQHFLSGNREIAPEISAQITQQEHYLKTISLGGRMDQRDQFIKPLTLLPAITFIGLKDDWETYKQAIYTILNEDDHAPNGDSTGNTPAVLATGAAKSARVKYEGLSITMTSWYTKLIADLDEEVAAKRASLKYTKAGLIISDILLLAGCYFLFFQYVIKPIDVLHKNTKEHRHTADFPNNELGDVANAINETVENLKDATEFVAAIGKGNLSMDYRESLDNNYVPGQNKLADSLIEMQAKLRELNEEEQKRQWSNEGLARFVDILRTSNDNLAVLGDKIISGLISYTNSNQGALYILNDEDAADKHLELISLYAWDIKKYDQQKIKPGQGILGQTFLEKETTYLTALPEEYVRITSGLGSANPKCVLIVPLKVDQDVYGLVELASFDEFKAHEIAFVEKLGETIASTLSSVKAAQRNKQLIAQFQQQTEEMRAQEEEMRQNMEELQATQEEIVRKEKSYVNTIHELEQSLKQSVPLKELEVLREKFNATEAQYQQRILKLEQDANGKLKSDDWEVAAELNRTLRVNLEALQITEEELKRKRK
jgi:GAF domain-containing protein/HAMP domain-containing protein